MQIIEERSTKININDSFSQELLRSIIS